MVAKNTDKDFWEKMLFANKVKRILEKLGIDSESFRDAYETDNTRPRREPTPPSDEEIEAVETFLEKGDYESFLGTLGATRVKGDSTIRRVLAWRGGESGEEAYAEA